MFKAMFTIVNALLRPLDRAMDFDAGLRDPASNEKSSWWVHDLPKLFVPIAIVIGVVWSCRNFEPKVDPAPGSDVRLGEMR